MFEEGLEPVDRLGAMLASWDAHAGAGVHKGDKKYWRAIIDLCDKSFDVLMQLDCLQLGCGEVLLGAIRCAGVPT